MTTTTKKSKEAPKEVHIDLTPIAEIATGIKNAKKKVASLKVESAEQCVEASKILIDIAKLRRIATKKYKERKDPVLEVSRTIDANRNEALTMIKALEDSVSAMIKRFRETEAAARAAIDEEKRKLAEQDAQQRRAQQEASIRAAAANAANPNVRALLEKQADAFANAHTIIEPIEPEQAPQTLAKGLHERGNAHAAVDRLDLLVLQVAAQTMLTMNPPEEVSVWLRVFNPNTQATMACLQPAMPHLNTLAKNIGATDLALEGVRVVEDSTFVAR